MKSSYREEEIEQFKRNGVEINEDGLHVDVDNKGHAWAIKEITGFQYFHQPERALGNDGRYHFIPLRGQEPKDANSSGDLEPCFPCMTNVSSSDGRRFTKSSFGDYDITREKYSRHMYPDKEREQ